jgi:hypothetical protein
VKEERGKRPREPLSSFLLPLSSDHHPGGKVKEERGKRRREPLSSFLLPLSSDHERNP